MVHPLDPTAAAFLMAENRRMPMHVGGLQLFTRPEGASRNYVRDLYGHLRESDDIAPLVLKHPVRSVRTGGQ
jgi:diacylglycerol O-acyltransferase